MTPDQVSHFENWLRQNGAEVLEPTNQYEVVRFRACNATFILYRNAHGQLSPVYGLLKEILNDYHIGRARLLTPRPKRTQLKGLVPYLLDRDGPECFYCGHPMDEPTVEHLVSLSQGGLNHLANLALAHAYCNQEAGTLSVVEKVRLRERTRREQNL